MWVECGSLRQALVLYFQNWMKKKLIFIINDNAKELKRYRLILSFRNLILGNTILEKIFFSGKDVRLREKIGLVFLSGHCRCP